MKLAIITEFYYPHLGGITEHVHNLAKAAAKKGFDVTVVTSNIDDNAMPSDNNYKVKRFGKSSLMFGNGSFFRFNSSINLGKQLEEYFRDQKFDVINIHQPIYPWLSFLALKHANCYVIGTFHSYFTGSNFIAYALKGMLKKIFNKIDGSITVSNACGDSLKKYVNYNNKVIPNGVDINFFNPNVEKIAKFDDGTKNLFFIGRFDPRTGLCAIIKMFPQIKKKYKNVRLIIAGTGPLDSYYRQLAKRYGAINDVHFIGPIRDERPNYYKTASIVLVPEVLASFGITLLEAMACGRPIVTFNIPGHDEFMTKNDGYMVDFKDYEGFKNAIIDLLNNEEKANIFGENAFKTAQNYSWEKVSDKIINFIEETIAK